jgi:hypothetical protein
MYSQLWSEHALKIGISFLLASSVPVATTHTTHTIFVCIQCLYSLVFLAAVNTSSVDSDTLNEFAQLRITS